MKTAIGLLHHNEIAELAGPKFGIKTVASNKQKTQYVYDGLSLPSHCGVNFKDSSTKIQHFVGL